MRNVLRFRTIVAIVAMSMLLMLSAPQSVGAKTSQPLATKDAVNCSALVSAPVLLGSVVSVRGTIQCFGGIANTINITTTLRTGGAILGASSGGGTSTDSASATAIGCRSGIPNVAYQGAVIGSWTDDNGPHTVVFSTGPLSILSCP